MRKSIHELEQQNKRLLRRVQKQNIALHKLADKHVFVSKMGVTLEEARNKEVLKALQSAEIQLKVQDNNRKLNNINNNESE